MRIHTGFTGSVLPLQDRDCIKVSTSKEGVENTEKVYQHGTLYEVVALVRNKTREDGITRVLRSSCGYIEHFKGRVH